MKPFETLENLYSTMSTQSLPEKQTFRTAETEDKLAVKNISSNTNMATPKTCNQIIIRDLKIDIRKRMACQFGCHVDATRGR